MSMGEDSKSKTVLLDLSSVVVTDIDGREVETTFEVNKDVANLVYRSTNEIDYLQPLQELSKEGKANFTLAQLDTIEQLVKKNYVLMIQVAIIDSIEKAREAAGKEDE